MMKIAFLLSAVISLSGLAAFAQAGANAQASTTVNAGNTHENQSAAASAAASVGRDGVAARGEAQSSAQVQMHPVNGELVGKLDAKTAKTGDPVVVKTTEAFRTSEGVLIPKGARLVGHVTEAQAHGNGNLESRLGIQFDRAELKNGESFQVHSTIESVAPPASAMAAAAMDSGGDVGMMGGGGRAMGGSHAGGGLLGGGAASISSTTGGVGAGLGHAVGGSVGAANSLTGNAGTAVGSGLYGAAAATGSVTAHATAVPGVMLQADAAGSASGVLSAAKRNVHLDAGTQMTLGVAGAVGR